MIDQISEHPTRHAGAAGRTKFQIDERDIEEVDFAVHIHVRRRDIVAHLEQREGEVAEVDRLRQIGVAVASLAFVQASVLVEIKQRVCANLFRILHAIAITVAVGGGHGRRARQGDGKKEHGAKQGQVDGTERGKASIAGAESMSTTSAPDGSE